MNLIRVLQAVPARHFGTHQTPMESLATTLALDRAFSLRCFVRSTPAATDVETLLINAMQARIWLDFAHNSSASVDDVLLREPLFRDLQFLYGVSTSTLIAAVSRGEMPTRSLRGVPQTKSAKSSTV